MVYSMASNELAPSEGWHEFFGRYQNALELTHKHKRSHLGSGDNVLVWPRANHPSRLQCILYIWSGGAYIWSMDKNRDTLVIWRYQVRGGVPGSPMTAGILKYYGSHLPRVSDWPMGLGPIPLQRITPNLPSSSWREIVGDYVHT